MGMLEWGILVLGSRFSVPGGAGLQSAPWSAFGWLSGDHHRDAEGAEECLSAGMLECWSGGLGSWFAVGDFGASKRLRAWFLPNNLLLWVWFLAFGGCLWGFELGLGSF